VLRPLHEARLGMNARDRILERIRLALDRGSAAAESESASAARDRLHNHPRGPSPAMDWEFVPRFRERCVSLSSTVEELARLDQVPRAVARYLAGNALSSACVCWPEFARLEWTAAGLQVEARPATGEDAVGVSGVFCAIAETGTLMLLSGPDTYATTSLLPETHIAVVPAARIVRSMEDGWDLFRKERGALPRQVTFVSGPSRTADIEMTLVLGIHGPYRVHVIVVGG
jgi:L-lactate dehydrogenase complex protein LldG